MQISKATSRTSVVQMSGAPAKEAKMVPHPLRSLVAQMYCSSKDLEHPKARDRKKLDQSSAWIVLRQARAGFNSPCGIKVVMVV